MPLVLSFSFSLPLSLLLLLLLYLQQNSWFWLFLCLFICHVIGVQSRKCPIIGIQLEIFVIRYPLDSLVNYTCFSGFFCKVTQSCLWRKFIILFNSCRQKCHLITATTGPCDSYDSKDLYIFHSLFKILLFQAILFHIYLLLQKSAVWIDTVLYGRVRFLSRAVLLNSALANWSCMPRIVKCYMLVCRVDALKFAMYVLQVRFALPAI